MPPPAAHFYRQYWGFFFCFFWGGKGFWFGGKYVQQDISKKVLVGRMTRSRQGKFGGGQPPLGLMRDPEERGHLILDPDTAPTIRKIYDLALNGWGGVCG